MTPRIEARDLHYAFGRLPVLGGVDLAVQEGEILAVLGPSGSGKTTLVRLLLGFLAPSRGTIFVRGEKASEPGRVLVPPEKRNLAVVFQDLALWPHMTVRDHLAFGLRARRVPRDEAQKRITSTLQRLGLVDKASRRPHELSGGERQRVAVARALVLEPDAILLDEPLSDLDIGLKAELVRLFRSVFREHGTAVIYVTHDPEVAKVLANRIAVVHEGRLVSLEELAARRRSGTVTPFVDALLERLEPDLARTPPAGRG